MLSVILFISGTYMITITSSYGSTVGYIEDGCIMKSNRSTTGYIEGTSILSSTRSTLFYVENGYIMKSNRSTIGRIDKTSIMKSNGSTIYRISTSSSEKVIETSWGSSLLRLKGENISDVEIVAALHFFIEDNEITR